MTIHYHGTPLTPRDMLWRMAGKHFCVSFAHPSDVDLCLRIGQSCMLDNGAFTLHTQGKTVDWSRYYAWLESKLVHPNWAVVPDVIDGDIEQNLEMIRQWPFRPELSCVVWHMAEPIQHLRKLMDLGFGKIAFGSSGQYWKVGSPEWCRRADEAFESIHSSGAIPWIHMMRGMAQTGKRWPFASVDSVNVARNFKDTNTCPESMARALDSVQCPPHWKGIMKERKTNMELF